MLNKNKMDPLLHILALLMLIIIFVVVLDSLLTIYHFIIVYHSFLYNLYKYYDSIFVIDVILLFDSHMN